MKKGVFFPSISIAFMLGKTSGKLGKKIPVKVGEIHERGVSSCCHEEAGNIVGKKKAFPRFPG